VVENDAGMAIINVKSVSFLDEHKKVQELNSRMLLSSVDFVEASLFLIAGGYLAQALVMLDNAIEVALKGELERIHPILITDTRELNDFGTLKGLLKDAFLKHTAGNRIDIPEFDIERTIYFDDAFDRVAELYPGLRDTWRKQLISSQGGRKDSLHALRNNIVHYGGNLASNGRYVAAIIDTAFPFLSELFQRMTGGTVSLPHLLKEWIYREVEVARLVLHDLQQQQESPQPYAIKTLQHHVLWTYAAWPAPNDDRATITYSGQTDWEQYVKRQKRELYHTWNEDFIVEVACPICGSETGDGSYLQAQVLLEGNALDDDRLVAEGFNCFVCGLRIFPEERFLAQYFVGQIPENIAIEYLKDKPR
jgi:hypothetical protein